MTKKVHIGYISLVFVLVLLAASFAGCTSQTSTPAVTGAPSVATPTAAQQEILIATTTSLYDTGLLDHLEPIFEKKYNIRLKITSQGTGKAIELAKKGDADLLLVHSPTQELAFINDGYGLNRRSFATNSFIIAGPANDPAGIRGMTPEAALTTLLLQGSNKTVGIAFVSRGDASGTHTAEKNVWKSAGYDYATQVQKSGSWYVEAGKGMGETLQMANEKKAYVLTDEGTFLTYKKNLALTPIISEGASLLNIYSVMAVYNDKQPADKIRMANTFINFLIDPETQEEIGTFGVDKYGKRLFVPLLEKVPTAKEGYIADFSTPATEVRPAAVPAAPAAAGST